MLTFRNGDEGGTVTYHKRFGSPFQEWRVRKIVQSPDFLHACTAGSFPAARSINRKPGPFTFLWRTRDGRLHAERIGVRRVLTKVDV